MISIIPDLPNHEVVQLNRLMQLQKKDTGLKGHLQPVSIINCLSDFWLEGIGHIVCLYKVTNS